MILDASEKTMQSHLVKGDMLLSCEDMWLILQHSIEIPYSGKILWGGEIFIFVRG